MRASFLSARIYDRLEATTLTGRAHGTTAGTGIRSAPVPGPRLREVEGNKPKSFLSRLAVNV